jgi:hypothetical protein
MDEGKLIIGNLIKEIALLRGHKIHEHCEGETSAFGLIREAVLSLRAKGADEEDISKLLDAMEYILDSCNSSLRAINVLIPSTDNSTFVEKSKHYPHSHEHVGTTFEDLPGHPETRIKP